MQKQYDVIVVGGGPAGYTAALYTARAGLKTLIAERALPGGQMTLTDSIENYPGFSEGVDGFTLSEEMRKGAERMGAETLYAEVLELALEGEVKQVKTKKETLLCHCVILAMGAAAKRLDVEGEARLVGRGVSYCAHCDGRFFKDKRVAVVGGGESAVAEALYLSRLCKEVYLLHRRDTLRAARSAQQQLERAGNVRVLYRRVVERVLGEEKFEGITVRDLKENNTQELALDALFVSIGRVPETTLCAGQLSLDENGYILADEGTQTSLAGVFAAGDIRAKTLRQVVTATADGAAAAAAAERYLSEKTGQ